MNSKADWRSATALYTQFSAVLNREERPHDSISGGLAESLARVFAAYEGQEYAFIDDLATILGNLDGTPSDRNERFQRLYKEIRLDGVGPYSGQNRRPRPFEASVETVWRIRDLNMVRDALEGLPSSAILGGSLSYGRFFNTCGASGKASDIDLLVILRDYDDLASVPNRLASLDSLEDDQITDMANRIAIHAEPLKQHGRCTFAHKFQMWRGDNARPNTSGYQIGTCYSMAIHFISLSDFKHLIHDDRPLLEDPERVLHEYRDDEPNPTANRLNGFAGNVGRFDQEIYEIELGFVNREIVSRVQNERYAPGVLQCLILPQFEVRWDHPDIRIRLSILNFRWKILARLGDERQVRPFEFQQLTLAHPRSEAFAPHVKRRVDNQ